MSKISVIVPVYNVEQYVDRCMESLFSQTHQDLDIILVDDGSTDTSGWICDRYAASDARVRVYHKENGGVSSARNFGLSQAVGDYIAFIDPDDWIEQNMYEKMMSKFFDGVDAVFCGYWEDPEEETGLTPILHQPDMQGGVNGDVALHQCLIGMGYGYFTSVWNKMFKADFLKKTAVEFEKYSIAEDELWLAKVIPHCEQVYLMNTPLYHWRQSPNSALRGEGNYEKWYSALEAKSKVVEATKDYKRVANLSVSKVYNDIFDIVWRAYINGDKKIAKDFMTKLKPYENVFYDSKDFSKEKRLKFFIIKLIIKRHFPKKIVEYIGTMNGYRIKEKMRYELQV